MPIPGLGPLVLNRLGRFGVPGLIFNSDLFLDSQKIELFSDNFSILVQTGTYVQTGTMVQTGTRPLGGIFGNF